MKVRFTTPALGDLDDILQHVSGNSPQGARRVLERIDATLNLLSRYPRIGVQTADPSIRRINTTPYPYLIFYEVCTSEIVVHAVRHGARDPDTMPGA